MCSVNILLGAHLVRTANPYDALPFFFAETSGYLYPSLQSLEQGSFTNYTKWPRRRDRMRKRQVVLITTLLFMSLLSVNVIYWGRRHWNSYICMFCDDSRRSRRRRRIPEGGVKLSGRSRLVPAATPRALSCPPNRHLTHLSRAPTDTTESPTMLLISVTLETTVRAGRMEFLFQDNWIGGLKYR